MAKKSRKRAAAAQEKGGAERGGYFSVTPPSGEAGGEISRAGWIVIAVSVLTAAAGYWLLSKAAPDGRDIHSNLSPFVILAGYIGVAVGIMWPERRGEGEKAPAAAGENSAA
ncbi:MAG: hypothetical protein RDU13_08780 [Elusimicrobiales bacterium]|jgi:hypothetical protein|nr:hypothetical protein [Elusimicrobiales bacterium]